MTSPLRAAATVELQPQVDETSTRRLTRAPAPPVASVPRSMRAITHEAFGSPDVLRVSCLESGRASGSVMISVAAGGAR